MIRALIRPRAAAPMGAGKDDAAHHKWSVPSARLMLRAAACLASALLIWAALPSMGALDTWIAAHPGLVESTGYWLLLACLCLAALAALREALQPE